MVAFGGVGLDQFVLKDAMPGSDKYKKAMETLRTRLLNNLTRAFSEALEREPEEAEEEGEGE